jgi:polysaccharide biosynthesis/export protein
MDSKLSMNSIFMKAIFIFLWLPVLLLTLTVGAVSAENADDILISPGDELKISVYNNPDLDTETKVSKSGFITFPLVGEVRINGLTLFEAEKKIASQLKDGGFLRNPQVHILAVSLQNQQASVLGHVKNQGRYPVEGNRNLTDIIAMAGGVDVNGGNVVTLIRAKGDNFVTEIIDIAELIRSNDMKRNPIIQGGDLIYVQRMHQFYIYGEVQRAGVYPLEHNMTVVQALSVGGGLTQRGTDRGVRIQRRNADDGTLQIFKAKHGDLVQPDDVIYVQESLF